MQQLVLQTAVAPAAERNLMLLWQQQSLHPSPLRRHPVRLRRWRRRRWQQLCWRLRRPQQLQDNDSSLIVGLRLLLPAQPPYAIMVAPLPASWSRFFPRGCVLTMTRRPSHQLCLATAMVIPWAVSHRQTERQTAAHRQCVAGQMQDR
jgi:hypothetical protein